MVSEGHGVPYQLKIPGVCLVEYQLRPGGEYLVPVLPHHLRCAQAAEGHPACPSVQSSSMSQSLAIMRPRQGYRSLRTSKRWWEEHPGTIGSSRSPTSPLYTPPPPTTPISRARITYRWSCFTLLRAMNKWIELLKWYKDGFKVL